MQEGRVRGFLLTARRAGIARTGMVREVAKLAGRKVCASSATVAAAGVVSLRCRLPRGIRRERHQHALGFGVTVTLSAPGISPQRAHRRITLPRIP